MKEHVLTTLDCIELGDPIQHHNLSVIPLFITKTAELNYISLKEGLDKKLVEITEVSEGGSVPNLKVSNNADVPLFIIDGEELVGAKQNRIVNTSLLLASKSEFVVPVSCTERGRWRYNSKKFADSGVVMSSKARSSKSNRVHASLNAFKNYNANQGEIWGDIEKLHAKSGTSHSSRTRAMKDAFEQNRKTIEEFLTAFTLQEGQNGMMVFENGKLVGGDLISNPAVYADLHTKLIKSYALEAVNEKVESPVNPLDLRLDAHQNLLMLKEAQAAEFEPVGLGKDIRLEGNQAKASALQYQEEVIHLTIYPKEEVKQKEKPTEPAPTPRPPHDSPSSWNLGNRLKRRFTKRVRQDEKLTN